MNDILSSLQAFFAGLPPILLALIILAGGWLAARLLRLAVSAFLGLLRFDAMGEKTVMAEFLRKGNARYTPSKLAGVIVYWVALLFAFLEVLRVLDPAIHGNFVDKLSQALPNLAAGILIIVVGSLLSSFLSNFVLTIALNASMPNARLLAKSIKFLGVAVVVTAAVEQIGLGRSIVEFIFQVLIGAVALGAALAFGLGCKDIARDSMLRFIANLKEKERDRHGADLEG